MLSHPSTDPNLKPDLRFHPFKIGVAKIGLIKIDNQKLQNKFLSHLRNALCFNKNFALKFLCRAEGPVV